jgi:hypothetical protein
MCKKIDQSLIRNNSIYIEENLHGHFLEIVDGVISIQQMVARVKYNTNDIKKIDNSSNRIDSWIIGG